MRRSSKGQSGSDGFGLGRLGATGKKNVREGKEGWENRRTGP